MPKHFKTITSILTSIVLLYEYYECYRSLKVHTNSVSELLCIDSVHARWQTVHTSPADSNHSKNATAICEPEIKPTRLQCQKAFIITVQMPLEKMCSHNYKTRTFEALDTGYCNCILFYESVTMVWY